MNSLISFVGKSLPSKRRKMRIVAFKSFGLNVSKGKASCNKQDKLHMENLVTMVVAELATTMLPPNSKALNVQKFVAHLPRAFGNLESAVVE